MLSHIRRGSGAPLVLLHGLGSRKEVWQPVLDTLAARREVFAVDLPGFGASPPTNRTDMGSLIGAVEAFLDQQGLARVQLAGSSMGGGIALELARRGRADRVTAFAPVGFWSKAERIWTQRLLATSRGLGRLGGERLQAHAGSVALLPLFAAFYGKPGLTPPEQRRGDFAGLANSTGFDDAAASFADYEFRDAAELDSVPVTVVWGSRDVVLPYRTQSRRARVALPQARHVTLPFADDPFGCAYLTLN